ncbi:hypothetical protein Ancab_014958 [Ancistrocladus abbreviatus]
MMKAWFCRKKYSRPFKEYYADWFETLKTVLLPLLQRSMSSTISSQPAQPHLLAELLHTHFQSYFNSLDLAASQDVSQVLFPDWRNSLEKPFLWLGDFHPYIFTNLLRSFLEDHEEEDDEDQEIEEFHVNALKNFQFLDKPWSTVMAWKNPSKNLMNRIEQIECGLRLIVPALVARAREAQAVMIDKVGAEWESKWGRKMAVVGKAVMDGMEELTCVILDANRLRRSVLSEIMGELDVCQAALFLEGLAQFYIGFRNSELLGELESCKMPPN